VTTTPTPYPSDGFAGASTLVVPASGAAVSTSGDTGTATMEPGEPQSSCPPIGKTVWYRLAPEAAGVLTATTAGSSFDTVLAAYSGASLAALAELACNDDAVDAQAELSVVVTAGGTYALQLGGFDGASGAFRLQVSLDTSRTALPAPTATDTPLPTSTPTSTSAPTSTPTTTATPAPVETPTPAGPTTLTGAATPAPAASARGQATAGAGVAAGGVAGPRTATAPVVATVSAFGPSTTRFALSNGYELSLSLDPAAVAALQATLPNVAQLWAIFAAAPALDNEVQRGSLGGGNVVPAGLPFALTILPRDSAGITVRPAAQPEGAPTVEAVAQLTLPVLPHAPVPNGVFAWLQAVYDAEGFQGYLRPPATFVPPGAALSPLALPDPLGALGAAPPPAPPVPPGALGPRGQPAAPNPFGVLRLRLPVGAPQGTLFLPAVVVPAYVQSFDPELHIYSGPFRDAIDFGVAAPQYTVFTVVAPQVGSRLFVHNPATQNYGWIDVRGVGPAGQWSMG
jgi:hypothetical protein